MYDLKAAQKNMQCGILREFMFYEFNLCHNATEVTKDICCAKVEGIVDPSNQRVHQIHSSCNDLCKIISVMINYIE